MSNLLDILNKSVGYLEKKKIENPRLTVEKILSEILEINRIMLYANFEKELTKEELSKIREKINGIINKNEYSKGIYEKKDKSLKSLLEKSIEYLEKNKIDESKLICEIVFSHILKIDRMLLFTKYNDILEEIQIEKIRRYIQKIGKEKFPVQYLLNEQEFYGRNFYVNKGVLIPRQDTEILVEQALKVIKNNKIENPKILDVGIGSGVIGLTLALEVSKSKIMGIDISEVALEVANKNKEMLKVENIKFFKSNLFENVEYKNFDIIISNPPYISSDEIGLMSLDTLIHEPEEALFAENEGLYFYYEISSKGYKYMSQNGYLFFEVGYKQGKVVKRIMEENGYKEIEIVKDLQGLDRVVYGKK